VKDFGIVHLTDLHYPVRTAAWWRGSLIRALERIPDDSLQVSGVAVTGDLADSPSDAGFKRAAAFLDEVASALKLAGTTKADRRKRIWVVDGNHDYRAFGNIRVSREGITAGGHITRLSKYFDEEAQLLLIGLNSCSTGWLARGGVAQKDLEHVADLLNREQSFLATARYRVALIHHHLLPLPAQPIEQRGPFGRVHAAIFDAGFKLLKNGGLVTRCLLQNGFDLVLHGHEHQAFAASVTYHDLASSRSLLVVGGVAAADGFQVIRFETHGGVFIERHSYAPTEGAVVPAPKMLLWNHADWQRMEWERASRSNGWYRRLLLQHSLDEIGDLEECDEIIEIHPGNGKVVEQIDRRVFVNPKHLGTCEIQTICDKEDGHFYSQSELSRPDSEIYYSLELKRPARTDRPHKGFIIKYKLYNAFAVTSRDVALRNLQPDRKERQRFGVTFPTSEVAYRFRFPAGRAPDNVQVEVRDILRASQIDFAETERASRELVYEHETVVLNLSWVLPRHEYIISWLPRHTPIRHDLPAARAREQLYALCMLDETRQMEICQKLMELRRRICSEHLECRPGDIERIELGLYAFDELRTRQLKWIAGTHSVDSPFREGALPWGVGIRGQTMRRRYPRFLSVEDRDPVYRPLSRCPRERSILSLPIPAPWDMLTEESVADDHTLPCAILTLSSLDEIPNMRRMQDGQILKAVSDAILKSALDILIPTALG
jgi:hypothetical protein